MIYKISPPIVTRKSGHLCNGTRKATLQHFLSRAVRDGAVTTFNPQNFLARSHCGGSGGPPRLYSVESRTASQSKSVTLSGVRAK